MTIGLVVSAEIVHAGLPSLEWVRQIAGRGFQAEIWDWSNHLDDLDELVTTDVEVISMTGYLRGNLTDDNAVPELLTTAEEPLWVAEELRCSRLNPRDTGLDGRGLPVRSVETVTGTMRTRATVILQRAAVLGGREGRVFTLENLNLAVDHSGTPFARAEDTLALIFAVGSSGLCMNLDLYHVQIGEESLIELCRRALPRVGGIQVVDVPGRCEPGTGEINYPAVAVALREMGYDDTVALEAFARSDPDSAIDAFIRAFTPKVE